MDSYLNKHLIINKTHFKKQYEGNVRSTSQSKKGLASLPSEGRAGLVGGSIGQSVFFCLLSRLPARQVWTSKKVGSRKQSNVKLSKLRNSR